MPSTSDETPAGAPPADRIPASPNPLGDAAATTDQVGLAANAMAAGMATAVAVLAVVTWLTARLAANSGITSQAQLRPDLPAVNVMIYGTASAIFIAFGAGWWLMRPIQARYRRGGLSMVGAFGGFLLGVILTTVVRGLLGPTALLALAVAAVAVAAFFRGRALAAA